MTNNIIGLSGTPWKQRMPLSLSFVFDLLFLEKGLQEWCTTTYVACDLHTSSLFTFFFWIETLPHFHYQNGNIRVRYNPTGHWVEKDEKGKPSLTPSNLFQARLEGVEHSSQDSPEFRTCLEESKRVQINRTSRRANSQPDSQNSEMKHTAHQDQKDYSREKHKQKPSIIPRDFFIIGRPTLHCSSSAASSRSSLGGGSWCVGSGRAWCPDVPEHDARTREDLHAIKQLCTLLCSHCTL
jgi:hypothetical protein